MTVATRTEGLIDRLTGRLLALVAGKAASGPRTFGFEYEFLPEQVMDRGRLDQVRSFLPRCGFLKQEDRFCHDAGMTISFEPGGQIEYHSPPLLPEDAEPFARMMATVTRTNRAIHEALRINYLPIGYIPGRGGAPLCLESDRYRLMHERLGRVGGRGREMMKGTASIHLHVGIRGVEELAPLYAELRDNLARSEAFGMKPDRRDIWDNTDPGRCGLPYAGINAETDPRGVIESFVRAAVMADVLGADVPFHEAGDQEFEAFLYHLTTIFTDIRLNIKGPTLELRTPDSVPPEVFASLWQKFIQHLAPITGNRSTP